jgi:AraC-like DNA-binding protein
MDCDEYADTNHIRVLPDTCVELFISYTSAPVAIINNELYKRSIITFRMNQPMDVKMRKGAGCLAICFYPGMAYKFLHVPMYVLTNTTTALSDLWNHAAGEIEEKLSSLPTNEARVNLAQNYLLQQLAGNKQDLQMLHCLGRAQFSGGLIPVSQLTDDTGLSQRQLSRKFQQHVGLSPKEYLRVCRFIQSLKYLKKYPTLSLTEVAYESGYFDQAHFNRDYKAFADCTPGEVVRARNILY